MAWAYFIPAQAFEHLAVQLRANRRHELFERARIEIHADVTRRLARGEGPGKIPVGLLNGDIQSWALPQGIMLTGELPPEAIAKRAVHGRLLRTNAPRVWNPETMQPTGREWVYPGDAADGVFRAAADMVRLRGAVLVEELLSK